MDQLPGTRTIEHAERIAKYQSQSLIFLKGN
jgi:hypothetical protein